MRLLLSQLCFRKLCQRQTFQHAVGSRPSRLGLLLLLLLNDIRSSRCALKVVLHHLLFLDDVILTWDLHKSDILRSNSDSIRLIVDNRVILLAYGQTLRDLVEQEAKGKWILVVGVEGNVFHSHGSRYQSLVVALVTDSTLVEVALNRVSHTDAEIVLIRRACYLISYLELAYFIVL